MKSEKQKAYLALEDGKVFTGWSFGASGERFGEVVFNTSMTGYQEALTDPSYKGQIVTMTYPLIGNYGVNEEDFESTQPWVEGFVVKENCPFPSNWRSRGSLSDFLKKYGIIGIEGLDTRALTKHIRTAGAMRGVLSTEDLNPGSLVEKARHSPSMVGSDWVQAVTCSRAYAWGDRGVMGTGAGLWEWGKGQAVSPSLTPKFLVVAIDFGIKHNIIRHLTSRGCQVQVVPAKTSAAEILSMNPQGIFLSNGPGDPAPLTYAIETVQSLLGKKPIFGICLGHQILGQALGGKTYKLKFGHRGANQPVKNLLNGKIEITTQNHGFCVDRNTLPEGQVEVTHVNLNDQSLEGMRHRRLPVFSVQYHPEASAGPHDSAYLFDEFVSLMEKFPQG
ncbi:MAG: glutamine-hydrolyzing carbamoyl-phosphate synthase small subunit [Thermodesulfobacteriota bacterium]|nr:glutamine-hydrolyzing carbamoyl-phosphate synthase small subunit [Thermodesulfobacteriota bacterium]